MFCGATVSSASRCTSSRVKMFRPVPRPSSTRSAAARSPWSSTRRTATTARVSTATRSEAQRLRRTSRASRRCRAPRLPCRASKQPFAATSEFTPCRNCTQVFVSRHSSRESQLGAASPVRDRGPGAAVRRYRPASRASRRVGLPGDGRRSAPLRRDSASRPSPVRSDWSNLRSRSSRLTAAPASPCWSGPSRFFVMRELWSSRMPSAVTSVRRWTRTRKPGWVIRRWPPTRSPFRRTWDSGR